MSNERLKKLCDAKSGCPAEATSISTAQKRCIPSTSTQDEAPAVKRDVEESLVRINLEAAEEIARQLTLAQYRRTCHLRFHRHASAQKSTARIREVLKSA